jgi:hypothetical protein
MSKNKQLQLVIAQNSTTFQLKPIKNQASLFKFKYLCKDLDPPYPNLVNLNDY